MIDFTTLQGLTIPEGVVTQIADESGGVLWSAGGKPIVLEVKKITSDTYAGNTTYTGERFILLDIYPKTNGTVKVTYGGLTKTITDTSGAAEPNAQQVFFGTFNGVSDDVETPASGTLTIKGDYRTYGCGVYKTSKLATGYCSCITDIAEWGDIMYIPDYAFYGCSSLIVTELPDGITTIGAQAFSPTIDSTIPTKHIISKLPDSLESIGYGAFRWCESVTISKIPSGVTTIGGQAFYNCESITINSLPDGITSIEDYTFYNCNKITSFVVPNSVISIGKSAFQGCPIQTLTLPEGLLTIGMDAFNSSELNGVTIPSTVTTIGVRAFAFHVGDYNNKFVARLVGTSPPVLEFETNTNGTYNYDQFWGSSSNVSSQVVIVVPQGCGSVYKAEESWIASGYADIVTEAS